MSSIQRFSPGVSDSRDGSPAQRVKTGIEGFDDILHGGLPYGHLYLIDGEPGTGKTTMALQYLLEGVRRGEPAMYVTLSESRQELQESAAGHGWTLEEIEIAEMLPPEDDLKPEAQYTVFHPSEVELSDTVNAIFRKVDEIKPQRLVFDSLSELRMLARDPLKYRRQILSLKRHISGRGCTTLLIDDATAERENDLQLQSIAHGVIQMETVDRDYGVNRRRMQVRKIRGSDFRGGFHDYTIRTGGVEIYPRLIAAEHKPGFNSQSVPSGIKELDDLFCGGIDTGTSTLLLGPAGCGKSTIAFRYALSSAQRGEKAFVFTFDELRETVIKRAIGLGMDPTPYLNNGSLEIQQIDPAEMSPGEFIARIRQCVDDDALRVLVIDSMNGLLNAMPHEQFLAMQLHELFSYLSQQGIATIVTLAQSGVIGTSMHSPIDVSYLADSVLLFRYFEREGAIRQALSVVKKRTGQHERTIRELIFSKDGISVGAPLSNYEGVLSGIPRVVGGMSGAEVTLGSGD